MKMSIIFCRAIKRFRYQVISVISLSLIPFLVFSEPVMKVSVKPVIRANLIEKLPLSGTLTSIKSSELTARVDGYVQNFYVDIGDKINKGDPLLQLDTKIAKLELLGLKANKERAAILCQDAEKLANKAKELAENKHISKTEYETKFASASACKAEVSELDAKYLIQQEKLNLHTLRAPFSGVVVKKFTEAGEWVNKDSSILRLVQIDPLYFEAQVPERFLVALG